MEIADELLLLASDPTIKGSAIEIFLLQAARELKDGHCSFWLGLDLRAQAEDSQIWNADQRKLLMLAADKLQPL